MDFATQLNKLRKAAHYSQEQLAEKIGVSRQAITKWETSNSFPECNKLIALADLFSVSLDHLVGREDTYLDIALTKVEALASQLGHHDEERVMLLVRRYMEYTKELGLPDQQIMNGLQYICNVDDDTAEN